MALKGGLLIGNGVLIGGRELNRIITDSIQGCVRALPASLPKSVSDIVILSVVMFKRWSFYCVQTD